MRQKLSEQAPSKPPVEPLPKITIRFGSLNINGLDLEATWAVEQLLETHELDVSPVKSHNIIIIKNHL